MENKKAVAVKSNSVMQSMSAKVIRCGCTDAQKARADWHGRHQKVCPNPKREEDLGVVSYWHRNPLKRLAFWFRKSVLRQTVHA